MAALNVSILTPQGRAFRGEARAITAPGTEGSFGVLPRHAAMIAALQRGIVKVTLEDAKEIYFAINRGFIEVRDNNVAILANMAQAATSLEEARIIVQGELKAPAQG